MRRVMLIGQSGSGKGDLIRALSDAAYAPARTMAVEFFGSFINTPDEFLENRRFYPALITASAQSDMLLFLHNAASRSSLFPPNFASAFSKRVIGVITYTSASDADDERAGRFLHTAGVRELHTVSFVTGAGVDELRALLL